MSAAGEVVRSRLRRLALRREAGALRLLVMAVADHCDQRCVHCQIWTGSARGIAMTRAERMQVVEQALAAGTREALLTGGEPLLSADLWPIARRLRDAGARVMLATNGMLLETYAAEVGRLFHEVYVSLDGASPATHDGLRGVPAFERVAAGVAALRGSAWGGTIVARSTLHAANLGEFEAIIETTRRLGFHHVSFLPLDAASSAFGGRPEARVALLPSRAQVEAFESAVRRLADQGRLGPGFVLESRRKLLRLARHLDASAGRARFEQPACDAPWWSAVVEADGSLRPCFFHQAVGDARGGLDALREGTRYRQALAEIRGPNPVCRSCVCPKWAAAGWRRRLAS